jgi:hypothetical protein
MKKEDSKNKKYYWIVGIIVILMFFALLISYYSNFLANEEVRQETANWKTYRNEEYGYEIKYPEDWVVSTEENSIDVKLKKVNCFFDIQVITKESYDDRENISECYKEGTIDINGISFERFPCPYTSNTNSVYSRYYFQKNERYYLIKLLDSEIDAVNEVLEEGKEIPSFINCENYFNQMLSTFRFLE